MLRLLSAMFLFATLAAPAAQAAPVQATWGPRNLYGETENPSGKPQGTVIVIHGGGWLQVGQNTLAYIRPEVARLNALGWRTVNIDYRAGWRSVGDVASWYDRVHRRYPGPVCAYGQSAGAHLALALAVRRPVDCVIGHGAITDLTRVGGSVKAATLRRDYVTPAFGSRAKALSPVTHAKAIKARVILAASADDQWSGCGQMRYLTRVRPATRAYCLKGGSEDFIHANVDRNALNAEHARERALLAEAARM